MKKADNELMLMEYTSSEKWQLFARYFEEDWHGGFNLVPAHANDNNLLKIPLIFATIIHAINFGIFTALIPALCQTGAALVGRKPLSEEDFDKTKRKLANLQGENLEKMLESLADLKPDSAGSKNLVAELNALTAEIKMLKEAICFHKISETDDKLEINPVISNIRLKQKTLLNIYFNSRSNIGTQTQQAIADFADRMLVENSDEAVTKGNPFSNPF